MKNFWRKSKWSFRRGSSVKDIRERFSNEFHKIYLFIQEIFGKICEGMCNGNYGRIFLFFKEGIPWKAFQKNSSKRLWKHSLLSFLKNSLDQVSKWISQKNIKYPLRKSPKYKKNPNFWRIFFKESVKKFSWKSLENFIKKICGWLSFRLFRGLCFKELFGILSTVSKKILKIICLSFLGRYV